MGGSRRKYKKSRTKVQVGLPKKNPGIYKPAFSMPKKLREAVGASQWDDKASVICNYKSFGVVSNPNYLGALYRTAHTVESESLQAPTPQKRKWKNEDDSDDDGKEFEDVDDSGSELEEDEVEGLDDSGSDLEEDDLKTVLSKKRKDGKSAPPQPLTTIQRIHIGRLVEKYGDNYQRMFMDVKLNKMQHSVATLEKLCKRYDMYKDQNPLILAR